jgi:hypothetical protein
MEKARRRPSPSEAGVASPAGLELAVNGAEELMTMSSCNRWMTAAVVAAMCAASANRAEAQRFGRGPTPGAGACFYENPNFEGDYFCIRAGDVIGEMPRGMNDRISSIRTFGRGIEVTVFQDSRFEGRSARFDDVRDLRRQGWNDRISSIRVDSGRFGRYDDRDRDRDRERGRYDDRDRDRGRSEDRRGPLTRERASAIVRDAYRSVLNREPDPASQGYVDRVMREGWTQEDVERELRRSPEYRQAHPR